MAKPKRKTKSGGIADRFIDLTEIDSARLITIWGRSGTGKTTISATAPKPILYLDIKDKGTDSAKSKGLEEGDITVLQVESFEDVMDAFDHLMDNPDDFKSVVADHLGALQELAYQKVMDDNNKTRMSQQLYGFAAELMKEFIDSYKDLGDEGILPVFLVQDRTRGGNDEGDSEQLDPEVGPALQPAVAKYLQAASRVVAQTFIDETLDKSKPGKVESKIEYKLRLGPHPYYQTKVTKPIDAEMPDILVNAKIQDIIDVVEGEWQENKKKKKPATGKKGKRNKKK